MSWQQHRTRQLYPWATPLVIVTGMAMTATPTFAATLASSRASVDIFSFSHSPYSSLTSVQTNTFTKAGTIPNANVESSFDNFEFPLLLGKNTAEAEYQAVPLGENTIADVQVSVFASESISTTDVISLSASDSQGSAVAATVEGSALVSTSNPLVSNRLFAQAFGDRGANYQGIAQGKSTILGKFLIGNQPEAESFSFTFNLSSRLAAVVENSQRARAKATSTVSFLLLGGANEGDREVIDFLSISSNLTKTPDFYENSTSTQNSSHFLLNLWDEFSDVDSHQIDLLGSYQRDFKTPTYLTLVEVKQTEATANVPEPLTTVGAGIGLLVGTVFKRKVSHTKKQKNLSENIS